MMKAYIIANPELDGVQKELEKNCEAILEFGDFKAEIFRGVLGKKGFKVLGEEGVKFLDKQYWPEEFRERNHVYAYNNKPGAAGCFASHFLLWKKCVEYGGPIAILEYDAKQVKPLPSRLDFDAYLYLSAWRNINAVYGEHDRYHEDRTPEGIHEYVGYNRWGFPNVTCGTHAYIIKPEAAKIMIDTAKTKGWLPADRFTSTDILPFKKHTINPAVFKVGNSLNTTNLFG